jgi:uncharacterized protein (TIGR03790 family)
MAAFCKSGLSVSSGFAVAAAGLLGICGQAEAGGTPENVLIIANPGSQESMYLANYYRQKRNVPAVNVLYINPGAANFQAFAGANGNIDAVLGTLRNRLLNDHIDYIVVAGTDRFHIDALGLVTDGCSPVSRFSQSSVYTMAFLRDQILAGNVPSGTGNGYYSINPASPLGFDSNTAYAGGSPSASAAARRYFIGAQLGYTGSLGNTLGDILQMIDRSVAVDGTHPSGTFYYMNHTGDPIRNIRACGSFQGCNGPTPFFTNAVNAMTTAGGTAEIITGLLPTGRQDVLGILTGDAHPPIDSATMTILPGAFCDHLTSWAATFDIGDQTKISAWIRRGASGTSGTVEEPCAYPGKFPHANMHVHYFQGLSLGEAHLRSLAYVPFQHLLVGDPLTRPFATFPTITPNVPGGTVSGRVNFTPAASTSLAGASIATVELLIDGVLQSRRSAGQEFSVNTALLAEGYHELRILAYDSTLVRNVGRWTGSFTVNNHGRGVAIGLPGTTGDLNTEFLVTPQITGSGTVSEVRLLHNGRVVAAGTSPTGPLRTYGRNLGAGRSHLQLEVAYADGILSRSAPMEVNVTYGGGPGSAQPVAYSYRRFVGRNGPAVLELPAAFPDNPVGASYEILTPPSQASIGSGSGSYRVITAAANACGSDSMSFRVTTPSGVSNAATITIKYGNPGCPADIDGDSNLTIADFTAFLGVFATGDLRADLDDSCSLNIADFTAFLQKFAQGCP